MAATTSKGFKAPTPPTPAQRKRKRTGATGRVKPKKTTGNYPTLTKKTK